MQITADFGDLCRTICPRCKIEETLSPAVLDVLGLDLAMSDGQFYTGQGCEECGGTGYAGRIGIYEYLPVSNRIREIILSNPNSATIKSAAQRLGMTTLREQVIAKGLKGITTYREILRVTQQDEVLESVSDAG